MAEGSSMAMDENLADQVQRQGAEIGNLTNQINLLQQQNQQILALLQALQSDKGKGKAAEDAKPESSAAPPEGIAPGGPPPGGPPAGGPNNNSNGDSEPPKEIWAFTNPAIKEMSKSVYSFPEAHKLRGA